MSQFPVATFLTALVLGLCGCNTAEDGQEGTGIGSPAFRVLINDTHAFPKTATYQWGPKYFKVDYQREFPIAEIDERLTRVFGKKMKRRGFTEVEADEADYTVGYALAVDAPIEEAEFNQAYGEDLAVSFPHLDELGEGDVVYQRGILIFDLVDNASGMLVWRGAIMAEIDANVSTREKERRIEKVLALLLAHLPEPSPRSSPEG